MNSEEEKFDAMVKEAFGDVEPSHMTMMVPVEQIQPMQAALYGAGVPVIAYAEQQTQKFVDEMKTKNMDPSKYVQITLLFVEADFPVIRRVLGIDKAQKTKIAEEKLKMKDDDDNGDGKTFH